MGSPSSGSADDGNQTVGGKRPVVIHRWVVLTSYIGVGVVAVVAVPALFLHWHVWPGFVIAIVVSVVVAIAVSAAATQYVQAAAQRAAMQEAEKLRDLILGRLPPSDRDPLARAHSDFVQHRFRERFQRYAGQAPWYGTAFNALSLGSIVAALASSGLAAAANSGNQTYVRWLVFAFGLLVAGLTGVNQLWRPAQRSTSRYRAANALRQEGWDFALGLGRYAGEDSKPAPENARVEETKAKRSNLLRVRPIQIGSAAPSAPSDGKVDVETVNRFLERVSKILRDAEAIDETTPEANAPPTTDTN